LICFGISYVASPEGDIVAGIADEVCYRGAEECIADEGRGVIVFGGYEENHEELEVFLGCC